MSVQMMNAVLAQINRQAQESATLTPLSAIDSPLASESHASFADILLNSIDSVNKMQAEARTLSQDYLTGKPGVGLNDVMVSLQKSGIALNLGIQVRNKMVNAYQEIMNMAV